MEEAVDQRREGRKPGILAGVVSVVPVRRRVRPVAKRVIKGSLVASDIAAHARGGLTDTYAEAKHDHHEKGAVPADSVTPASKQETSPVAISGDQTSASEGGNR